MREREARDGAQCSPERHARYHWAADLIAGSRVLDAACGSGWGTAVLAGQAESAVGIDFSPPAIAAARRDRAALAEFREGDLRDLPCEDAEFDHVVCFEAIAHVPEPAPVLDELRRVLRPGGLLLVSSPNRGVYPPGNPLHLSEMTSEELRELLAERFLSVALHRQQTYFASLLGSAGLLAHGSGDGTVHAEVTKVAGHAPGSELHAVAVATDGELPAAPAQLSIGDQVDYGAQRRLLDEWQSRAVEAEAEVLALRRKLRDLQT